MKEGWIIVPQMQLAQTHLEVITAIATLGSLEMDFTVQVSSHAQCAESYTLLIMMHLLPDINECETINGGCEQICTNIIGSFVCSCETGYLLDGNGFNCTGMLPHYHWPA